MLPTSNPDCNCSVSHEMPMIWRDHAPMVPTSAAATRRDPGQPDTGLLAATDARSGTVRGEGVKEGRSRNKIECFFGGNNHST